jgi:hypothetical protein
MDNPCQAQRRHKQLKLPKEAANIKVSIINAKQARDILSKAPTQQFFPPSKKPGFLAKITNFFIADLDNTAQTVANDLTSQNSDVTQTPDSTIVDLSGDASVTPTPTPTETPTLTETSSPTPVSDTTNATPPAASDYVDVQYTTSTPLSPTPAPDQQDCINNAQATKDAAVQAAASAFSNSVKDVLATEKSAIAAAQQIQDETARLAAIKSANDDYNNNGTVQQARIPYIAAVKAANQQFQSDSQACSTSSSPAGLLNAILRFFNFFVKWK